MNITDEQWQALLNVVGSRASELDKAAIAMGLKEAPEVPAAEPAAAPKQHSTYDPQPNVAVEGADAEEDDAET